MGVCEIQDLPMAHTLAWPGFLAPRDVSRVQGTTLESSDLLVVDT